MVSSIILSILNFEDDREGGGGGDSPATDIDIVATRNFQGVLLMPGTK